jgi:hypothetical protein
MAQNHKFTNSDGKELSFECEEYPSRCPICDVVGQPNFVAAVGRIEGGQPKVYAGFRCPASNCRGLYVAVYAIMGLKSAGLYLSRISRIASFREIESPTFPAHVRSVSPSACEIYRQADIAEANGLNLVIGPAYRKALEFLIKDFVIKQKFADDQVKQQDVRKKFLGNVIADEIDETVIKECAKRATWLGNDETHYTRKWEDKDVNDLKALIKITMSFIDMSLEAARYLKEMPKP